MKNLLTLILITIGFCLQAQKYRFPSHLKKSDYVAGQLIAKLKPEHASLATQIQNPQNEIKKLMSLAGFSDVRNNFPSAGRPDTKTLELYLNFYFNENSDIYSKARILETSGLFSHVQPRFVSRPMATPDDPMIGQQYHHALIKTFEAWDIEEGDTTVLIGITDAGIQFDHMDLGNWQYNYADPENGIDDDNNGYTDDIAGWNTANNTNDPTATLSPHGMFTTGLSSATVNNGIGIAGNAYRCRYVPIRIDDAGGFNYGYEGIIYAAERGCQIINASWGNTFYDPMAADVVDYAVNTKGCLIIAASGNSGLNETYYPASYPGVMSVGATGATDVIWNQSTFSPFVDIVAPGELLQSTWPFNGYDVSSGTSFSSPLVAGAAAIVKSHFPEYNAAQIQERLRVTADTALFELPGNDTVALYMGAGRLNMLRALTDPDKPGIRIINSLFTDNNDEIFIPGDTIRLQGDLFNHLADAQNLSVLLSCLSTDIEVVNSSLIAGNLDSQNSYLIPDNQLSFRILGSTPYNLNVDLRLDYFADGYHGWEMLRVQVNNDYLNISSGDLSVTAASNGNIGYSADYAENGIGIRFAGSESLIYSSSFMLGSSDQKMADNAYAAELPGYDSDFFRTEGISFIPGNTNDLNSSFATDSAANPQIDIIQRVLASPADENYINFRFTVKNNSGEAVNGLHGGIFTDWDINDALNNTVAWDVTRKMSYASAAGGPFVGWVFLGSENIHPYHFNNDGSAGSIMLYDGFTNAEKFTALSGEETREDASGEISALIGTESFNLNAGDSLNLRFALVAGNNQQELIDAANAAIVRDRFEQLQLVYVAVGESCAQNDGFIQFFTEPVEDASVRLIAPDETVLIETTDIWEFEYNNLGDGEYTLEFIFGNSVLNQLPLLLMQLSR
ncbi:MAG: S8 family serine peptidase [Bacteroidia bacterium]